MPTGYTAKIEKGQTFEDFVLGCARAFGACIDQRDDPSGDKPKLRESSSHHEQRLIEDSAELGALTTMNRAQKTELGQELKDKQVAAAQKYFNEKVALKNKYDAMLDRVREWNPPTPDHANLKTFMIEQINSSIDFDCNLKYTLEDLEKKTKMSPIDFYDEEVKRLEWSVKYHEEEMQKETTRTTEANEWILHLYRSLGIDYSFA